MVRQIPNIDMANPPPSDIPKSLLTTIYIPTLLPWTKLGSPLEPLFPCSYLVAMFSVLHLLRHGVSSPPSVLAWWLSFFFLLSVPSPGILKVLPLSALLSHWLLHLYLPEAGSLTVLYVGFCMRIHVATNVFYFLHIFYCFSFLSKFKII